MIRFSLIFSLIILCPFYLSKMHAQELNNYRKVDKYIRSITPFLDETYENLAQRLICKDWNDYEKVRAIFSWMALNISYDIVSYSNKSHLKHKSDKEKAQSTYKTRKGVCSGYACLFKSMCGAIGFEAEVVSGYIRKREQAGISIKEPNHDWNVVKVSGKWELIDVTWASTSKERFYIDYFYFLTPAQEFITNHFPEDKKWQLLEKPILKEEFDAYPFMSSSYFKYGLDLDFPKTGYIKNTSGKFTLRVKKPDAGDWKVTVYNINTGEWNDIYYSYDKELGQLEIVLKRKGIYLISLDVIESTFFDFYHSNTNILCFNIEYY